MSATAQQARSSGDPTAPPGSISVSRVARADADRVFRALHTELERGLRQVAGRPTSYAQLRDSVLSGEMIMWAVQDGPELLAAVILSVRKYSSYTALVVELAAGRELERWAELVEELLRDYRELVGAEVVEALCRGGMAKKLAARWKKRAVLMELR